MLTFHQFNEALTAAVPWKWTEGYEPRTGARLGENESIQAVFDHPTFPETAIAVTIKMQRKYARQGRGERLDTPETATWDVSFHITGKGFDKLQNDYWERYGHRSVLDRPPSPTSYGITKTGGSFAIFATMAEILKDFVQKKKPRRIHFTSRTNEPSRTRLYQRLVDRVSSMSSEYKGKRVPPSRHRMGTNNVEFEINRKMPRRLRTPNPITTTEEPESARTVAPREDPPTRGTHL